MSLHRRAFFELAGFGALSAAFPKPSFTAEIKSNSESVSQTSSRSAPMAIADKSTYLKRLVLAFKREWPNNRLINIICHGHSVPAGYFKTPLVNTFNAYPHLLHWGLKELFPYCVSNVIVTAIGGENSRSGADRFERDVLCHQPDLITIDYALNDRGLGLSAARTAWVEMIEKTLAEKIYLILLTPTPDEDHNPDNPNEPLNQHAEQIRQLATEYEVGLVDSLAGFDAYEGNLTDLLSQINHPNRQGHEIVATELLKWFTDNPPSLKVDKWKTY